MCAVERGEIMYIYRYGAIGDAIRAKIENTKQYVQGGGEAQSFGELLHAQLYKTEEKKPVSAAASSGEVKSASGSALIYAMQNSGEDSTASAVLETLGFGSSDGEASADTASKAVSDYLSALSSGDSSANLYASLLSADSEAESLYSTLLSGLL